MNIRIRTVSGVSLAIALLCLSILHALWAAGSPFPAQSFSDLQAAVFPGEAFPAPLVTLAVALALFAGSVAAALRTLDLNRSRQARSRLLRLGVYGLAAVFALRGVVGMVLSASWLVSNGWGGREAVFYQLDVVAYSPLCLALAAASFVLARQARVPRDHLAHAISVFRRVQFVHLVTLAPDGSPRSRVVARLSVESDGVVWLSTDRDSQKVHDIHADPRVVLSAYDSNAQAMASFEATATVVSDPDTLEKHWAPYLRLYFTRGRADERYCLVRVEPHSFSVLDFSNDVAPQPFGLRHVTQQLPVSGA